MTSPSSVVDVLRIGDFRRYYIGHTASAFGDSLTPFAIAFAVLHLTGSPSDLGLVVLSTRLPQIVFALVGGAVGDRFSRRTVMLFTDLVRFGAQGATAAILLTGTARVWMLIVLQLIAGAGAAFFTPAAQGLVTSVVDKDRLQQANSLLTTSRSATSILAVGTAGALVAIVGPGWALAADAVTFLVSALVLSRLPRSFANERLERRQGLFASIRTGLAEVRNRPWLRLWTAHVALINLFVIAPIFVLGPYVADRHLGGAPAWAAIGIGYTLGGVLGGVVSARWQPARPMAAALIAFLLIVPLPALLAGPAAIWLLVPASVLGGVQVSIYNVFQTTALQHDLPNDLIARATSVLMVGSMVAMPLGMGLAGPIATALGTRAVLATIAGVAVLITAAALLVPAAWSVHSVGATAAEPQPGNNTAPDSAS